MARRSGPRLTVRRPERRFNSIHWRRSAKLKVSRPPRSCSTMGRKIVASPHVESLQMPKKGARPAPAEKTTSGIPVHPFYGEPAPGEFPFTRGISKDGYRERFWTMRQYAGFGPARDSNRRYRYLLEHGQTGLSIAFDLPTYMG